MPGGDDFYDDIEESIVESVIILGLAGALAFLVWYRQQRQQNHHRAAAVQQQIVQGAVEGAVVEPAGQQQQQQGLLPGQLADGGFFPAPGDPNYGQWVAGGIGH